MKKVSQLKIKSVKFEDHLKVLASFKSEETIKMGKGRKSLFKYVIHSHEDIATKEDVIQIVSLMNEAIEVLSLSVDNNYMSNPIECVHYIVSEDIDNILIYLELKEDAVSSAIIPRFLGNKFSNIEALRRISTNLSGQYAVNLRVYV